MIGNRKEDIACIRLFNPIEKSLREKMQIQPKKKPGVDPGFKPSLLAQKSVALQLALPLLPVCLNYSLQLNRMVDSKSVVVVCF